MLSRDMSVWTRPIVVSGLPNFTHLLFQSGRFPLVSVVQSLQILDHRFHGLDHWKINQSYKLVLEYMIMTMIMLASVARLSTRRAGEELPSHSSPRASYAGYDYTKHLLCIKVDQVVVDYTLSFGIIVFPINWKYARYMNKRLKFTRLNIDW